MRACREDGWVLDEAALDRPLFPAVDEATGNFLFTESFQVRRMCRRLIETGARIGMNKHKVGAWSLRKDACEQPAAAGDGEVAARVLGHRQVNSRTMDRVYRADLRTRDLGAYWMRRGALESVERAPQSALSATRVPEASGVRGLADLPADCPEREAMRSCERVAAADAEVEGARRELAALLGVADLPWGSKAKARAAGHGDAADRYEAARKRRFKLTHEAREHAVEEYRLRVYKEGLERLRTTPSLRRAMLSTHAWGPRSEDEAIAFGLDRRDRTGELRALRELPAALQGSILRVGALHVLPRKRPRQGTYGHVRERCEQLCSLTCGSEECGEDGPAIPWPDSAHDFEALRCERCGDAVQLRLRWRREVAPGPAGAAVAGEAMAAGATAALGASHAEAYGVWYTMCGRATIGNAAYEAGVDATEGAPPVDEDAEALPSEHSLQAMVDAMDESEVWGLTAGVAGVG